MTTRRCHPTRKSWAAQGRTQRAHRKDLDTILMVRMVWGLRSSCWKPLNHVGRLATFRLMSSLPACLLYRVSPIITIIFKTPQNSLLSIRVQIWFGVLVLDDVLLQSSARNCQVLGTNFRNSTTFHSLASPIFPSNLISVRFHCCIWVSNFNIALSSSCFRELMYACCSSRVGGKWKWNSTDSTSTRKHHQSESSSTTMRWWLWLS